MACFFPSNHSALTLTPAPEGCTKSKAAYTAIAVGGVALLAIGLIALAAYCNLQSGSGPISSFLGRVNGQLHHIASSIGTDPLLLISFSIGFGAAFTLAGVCRPLYPRRSAEAV